MRAVCRHHRAPFALHAGLNDLVDFGGIAVPKRLRSSPLNLIHRSLVDTPPGGLDRALRVPRLRRLLKDAGGEAARLAARGYRGRHGLDAKWEGHPGHRRRPRDRGRDRAPSSRGGGRGLCSPISTRCRWPTPPGGSRRTPLTIELDVTDTVRLRGRGAAGALQARPLGRGLGQRGDRLVRPAGADRAQRVPADDRGEPARRLQHAPRRASRRSASARDTSR